MHPKPHPSQPSSPPPPALRRIPTNLLRQILAVAEANRSRPAITGATREQIAAELARRGEAVAA